LTNGDGHNSKENLIRYNNLKRYLKNNNISDIHLYINGSDNFFETNDIMFDSCIIDGDHSRKQTEKDLKNCIEWTKEGGIIFTHPCYYDRPMGPQNLPIKDTVIGLFMDYKGNKDIIKVDKYVGVIYR
jgi:hypothetical protein